MKLGRVKQVRLFAAMAIYFRSNGFDITNSTREIKKLGLKAPKAKRGILSLTQVSYEKEIEGYKIVVRTSYDPNNECFTETGRIWVHITKPTVAKGEDTLYTSFFYRNNDCVEKLICELNVLVHCLKTRPLDKNNRPMELIETSPCRFNWVSASNDKYRKSFFYDIPKDYLSFVKKQQGKKLYYEKNRKRMGIKKRARNIRKPWKVLTPQNAIPVM